MAHHPDILATIQDTLADSVHDDLDAQVNGHTELQPLLTLSTLSPGLLITLLQAIIAHSGGRLNDIYLTGVGPAGDLVDKHSALRVGLRAAWAIKKYRSIRLLEILQAPPVPIEMSEKQRTQLSASFHAPFVGAAVEGFFEYLDNNERLFRAHTFRTPYYAKFCSIVQSSGTGKSRVLTELSKKNVVVLYINLRDQDDTRGFPFRDPIPCTILESPGSEDQYTSVCEAFMTAVFETSLAFLQAAAEEKGTKAAIQHWTNTLCNMELSNATRNEFFLTVQAKYDQWLKICSNVPSSDPAVQLVAEELRTLSLSGLQGENRDTVNLSRTAFLKAYHSLGAYLEEIIKGAATQPRFVLAIDEAHPLGKPRSSASQGRVTEYRPADILTRVINVYSHHGERHAIWVVFASTTSRVADFSPPNRHHNSLRIAIHGQQLFPPYTQLGWDQCAPALGGVDADDIAKISHILTYGRPLWKSLLPTVDNPKGMLAMAATKLFGGRSFDPENIAHVLAAFGQRFALEVTLGHPDSVQALQTAVASHLRICLSTTLDRSWIYTSYPSEPLLSCVAAIQLHSSPDHLTTALNFLEVRIKDGMVNIGEHGELVSRLLWLLAKDLYVRKNIPPSEVGLVPQATGQPVWSPELLDCKMIPVVDWLKFVFGPNVFGTADKDVCESFANACINFSHWLSMDSNVSGGPDDLPLGEWTLCHWQRTSAVQCTHNQPRIDKVIPIYFKDPEDSFPLSAKMSQIFISDKARKSDSKKSLNFITRNDPSLGHLPNGLPYIAILCDLGLTSSALSATFSPRNVSDPCLRIYAAGIDATTYPFLKASGVLLSALQNIVSLQKQPENELPRGKYLDAQVRFGKAPTADYMDWGRGKQLPPSKHE